MRTAFFKRIKPWEIIFWLAFFAFWVLFYWNLSVVSTSNDYYYHNLFTKWIFSGEMMLSYPGYHLLTGGLNLITGLSIEVCGAIWLSLAMIASVVVTYLLISELCSIKRKALIVPALLVNIVQPLCFSGYAPGYSSGNGYVSPTQAMCKPFALLSVLLFYRIYRDKKRSLSSYALLTASLIVSCIFKPLFAMAFVPAMGLLVLSSHVSDVIKRKTTFLHAVWDYVISVLPLFFTGLVLLAQFFLFNDSTIPYDTPYTNAAGSSEICFGFLKSWSLVVDNVWLSILFAYLFPLCMAAAIIYAAVRKEKCRLFSSYGDVLADVGAIKPYLKMCATYAAVSFFYFAFLYQNGIFIQDCNFRNAWVITFSMVYIAAISLLWKWLGRSLSGKKRARGLLKQTGNLARYIRQNPALLTCGALLFVHILFGAALICKNMMYLFR